MNPAPTVAPGCSNTRNSHAWEIGQSYSGQGPNTEDRSLQVRRDSEAIRWESRGRSSAAEHQLPKLRTRVRFPSPAPIQSSLRGLGFAVLRSVALIATVRSCSALFSTARCRSTVATSNEAAANFCRHEESTRPMCHMFVELRLAIDAIPQRAPETSPEPGRLGRSGSEERVMNRRPLQGSSSEVH